MTRSSYILISTRSVNHQPQTGYPFEHARLFLRKVLATRGITYRQGRFGLSFTPPSKISVMLYPTTRRHFQDDCNLHSYSHENLILFATSALLTAAFMNTVAFRPVAKKWLCKQRPKLGNARNNRTGLCNPILSNGSVNTPLQQQSYCWKGCFLFGPCKVVIKKRTGGTSATWICKGGPEEMVIQFSSGEKKRLLCVL
jgi:hypothetical protein